jgi:hypothetical protein
MTFSKGNIPWNKGKRLPPDFGKKISLSLKGRKLSDETKRKIGLFHKGNKWSQGCKQTAEARMKVSLARRGCIPWNRGVQAWNHGRSWDVEVKNNISRGMTVDWMIRKQTAATAEHLL